MHVLVDSASRALTAEFLLMYMQALLGTQVNQKTGRARRISPVRALRADHAVSRNLSPQERVERLLHTESAGNQAGKASVRLSRNQKKTAN